MRSASFVTVLMSAVLLGTPWWSVLSPAQIPGHALFVRRTSVTIEAWAMPHDIAIHGKNSGDITIAAYGPPAIDGKVQHVIARDAHPAPAGDVEDTVLLGPGPRVDVVVTADAKPGTWLVHCHILDHTQGALDHRTHYRGTPDVLAAMDEAMHGAMAAPARESTSGISRRWLALSALLAVVALPAASRRRARGDRGSRELAGGTGAGAHTP